MQVKAVRVLVALHLVAKKDESGVAPGVLAGPEAVERWTGFAPGAVAPFPLPQVDRVLIDHGLLPHEVVWIGAGSDRHIAGLAPIELVRLARARPVDIAEDL